MIGNENPDENTPWLRADAQRNHDRLIDAAAVVFVELGVDAPIKDIAHQAGVGVGTVYRRFPKRSDLIVAVFRREVDDCADFSQELSNKYEPSEALRLWIERYVDLIVTKRGLATALHSGEVAYEGLPQYFESRLLPSLKGLLMAAGAEGQVEKIADDLLRGVALLCAPASSGDLAQTRRMVAWLLNGLRFSGSAGPADTPTSNG